MLDSTAEDVSESEVSCETKEAKEELSEAIFSEKENSFMETDIAVRLDVSFFPAKGEAPDGIAEKSKDRGKDAELAIENLSPSEGAPDSMTTEDVAGMGDVPDLSSIFHVPPE